MNIPAGLLTGCAAGECWAIQLAQPPVVVTPPAFVEHEGDYTREDYDAPARNVRRNWWVNTCTGEVVGVTVSYDAYADYDVYAGEEGILALVNSPDDVDFDVVGHLSEPLRSFLPMSMNVAIGEIVDDPEVGSKIFHTWGLRSEVLEWQKCLIEQLQALVEKEEKIK